MLLVASVIILLVEAGKRTIPAEGSMIFLWRNLILHQLYLYNVKRAMQWLQIG